MTVERAQRLRLVMATGVAVLACGIILWPIPYAEVALLHGRPSLPLWLLLGGGAGLVAGFLLRRQFVPPMLTVPVGFALAVLGRVAVEVLGDPTSHSLWPLEVGIATGVGTLAGIVGVGLARLAQRSHADPGPPTQSEDQSQ
jgi:hypothetical protein